MLGFYPLATVPVAALPETILDLAPPPGGRVPAAVVYCPGAAQAAVGSPGGAVGHVYTPGAAAVEVEG